MSTTTPRPVSPLRALRREAGVSAREAAATLGLCLSDLYRLEGGTLALAGRDEIRLLGPLARLLSARLGRPISAQFDLVGSGRPRPLSAAARAGED